MGYRKFSEHPQDKTLGGLAALGAQHPQISKCEIEAPTPPKVAKAPKVLPLIPAEPQKSTCTPPKAPKAPKVSGRVCAQCGGGPHTNPVYGEPTVQVDFGAWVHAGWCHSFWLRKKTEPEQRDGTARLRLSCPLGVGDFRTCCGR